MKWHRKVLVDLIKRLPPAAEGLKGVAEVGVSGGKTSAYILKHCPEVHLSMIDRWRPPDPREDYCDSGDLHANLSAEGHFNNLKLAFDRTAFAEERRTIIIDRSQSAGTLFQDDALALVFLDADHTYQGIALDLQMWWPVAKHVICGHNFDRNDPDNGVTTAVRAFADGHNCEIETHPAQIWAIWKDA